MGNLFIFKNFLYMCNGFCNKRVLYIKKKKLGDYWC